MYKEDYSAKTFSRPEFSKLLSVIKYKKHSINLLLFLKWDRFSRNAGDAYFMIKQLNQLGVEPHAIEQPLDLSIPENKLMLAFYLAAPEVENDRRSLNIVMGMRRARKEGRYVNKAPIGYKNTRDERNNPIVVPSNDAFIIKFAFEEMAKGITSIQDSWRRLVESGIKLSRSQTHELFRNPFYCGKVIIPAYKEEKMEIIYGIHDGIVSEGVFNKVQDVLEGRKLKIPLKEKSREEFPLRGLLKCKKCNKRMTASASRGNGGKYFYYHCSGGCKVRYRTEYPNKLIIKVLKKIKANQIITDLYKSIILKYVFQSCQGNIFPQVKNIQEVITLKRRKLQNALQLRLNNEIEAEEYKGIKTKYEDDLYQLLKKESELMNKMNMHRDYLDQCLISIDDISDFYKKIDEKIARQSWR